MSRESVCVKATLSTEVLSIERYHACGDNSLTRIDVTTCPSYKYDGL